MKKIILSIFATVLLGMNSVAYGAVGDIINIQLGSGAPLYDNGAAINDDSGQTWNRIILEDEQTIANLQYSDGSFSGVSVNDYMSGTAGLSKTATAFPEGTTDQPLMRGYLFTDEDETGYINLTGLDAGTYKVYVYSQVGTDLPGNLDMTANGASYSLSNNGDSTSLIEGTNWMVKTVTVAADGKLSMSFAENSQINGLQIEAVPEPGSVVLLGIGGAFVLGLKRLKSKEESAVA